MFKKKRFIIPLVVLVIYVALQVVPYRGFDGESKFKISEGEAPLVIAHGGAKHLYPENTIMAFENSYDMGVDVLETDLCLTSDGILIAHHDLTIDATSDGFGDVISYSYDEIKEFNFGYDFKDIEGNYPYRDTTDETILETLIPMSLEDMFKAYGNNVLYILEIKNGDEDGIQAANELNSLIEQYNLQEYVTVASFHNEVMTHFMEIRDERVDIAMDLKTATSFVVANYAGYGAFLESDYAGLMLPPEEFNIPLDTSYLTYKIHHNNMFVHYWTINTKEEMKYLISIGADGIITDRPDLMFEVLEELGF